MVRQVAFFDDSASLPDGVRLAPLYLDFRWRLVKQGSSGQQHPAAPYQGGALPAEPLPEDEMDILEDFPPPPPPPGLVSPPPPQVHEEPPPKKNGNGTGSNTLPPHIALLKLAQLYKDEWRPAKIETSASKSYAFLLPRDSKLSLAQAIKQREALVITLDQNGKVTIQDLRRTAPKKKEPWWKNIFGWF